MHKLFGELSGEPIGQVPATSTDALLYRPGVGTLPQQPLIVILFEDDEGAVLQGLAYGHRGSAEVRCDPDFEARPGVGDGDRDGVRRIMACEYRVHR